LSKNEFEIFKRYINMYTENRAGPSNIGNVISQILLCKQIQPDFNQEEVCSIAKDSQDLAKLIQDMQEFLPQQDTAAGMFNCFVILIFGESGFFIVIIMLCTD
jgi:hypothetical protein